MWLLLQLVKNTSKVQLFDELCKAARCRNYQGSSLLSWPAHGVGAVLVAVHRSMYVPLLLLIYSSIQLLLDAASAGSAAVTRCS
jgi:hypothetical protein